MRLLIMLVTLLALGATYGVSTPPRAHAAANQLFATQYCENGRVKVIFSWTGGNPASIEQWLDLSIFNNGWQDGSFIYAGPLAGSLSTYTWEGLTAGTQHYVRVNQQMGNRSWDPSQTFPVMTIGCGATTASQAPSSGGPSVSLLGFSANYSGGSPPPNLIAPGATALICNSSALYAFVQVNSVTERTDFFVSWLINSSTVPKAPITVQPGTNLFVLPYTPDTPTYGSVRYTLRLTTIQNGPPVLEGGFTAFC